ncbi:hypothetical protein [Thermaerobacillus caldiproteolyticus]|uniref:Uncharacterized protein n=1 Tax=Thermaerobacillus caldiproteolyticus TaxID=247480 RepID=A0A7V9Z7K2_9BACL|nr:hypothetical protein [Anoxybacillus caldiproteolyticus]MBA2875414.1 hypothetical protein [Anoxybacillus caldiproteolyticus]QPA32705.1 hypothetical protein ISX45_07240 [Anoxybacillus caldiproteolyticus]
MGGPKQPKFSLGDVVVNTLYGTVGTITDIQQVDGAFLYEINHSHSLFMEHTLVLLSEFTGDLWITEEIEIELPFFLGEIVRVKDYGHDLFKIIGVRTEIYRYQDGGWEEIIYELKRLFDGLEIEANIDDVISLTDYEETSVIILQDVILSAIVKPHALSSPQQEKIESIDGLLDLYNDYKRLYEWFGDEQYKHVMELVLNHLHGRADKKELP